MNQKISRAGKNMTIEGCKLLAAFFVVCLHVPFPGDLRISVDALSRFAVPFFFLVSGYFNYNASVRRISGRLLHIAKLTVIACLFYIVWYSLLFLWVGDSVFSYLSSVFTVPKLLNWLVLNLNPFSDHLWYLSALLYCYVLFLIYTALFQRKHGYLFLYISGSCLLLCTLMLDGPVSARVMYIPHYIYRNAWFMGSSAFILGLFLHELIRRYPRLLRIPAPVQILLILAGQILAVVQKYIIGTAELSGGAVIASSGLLLYAIAHPDLFGHNAFLQKFLSRAGNYSTTVYIIHLAVINLYDAFLLAPAGNRLGSTEPFLRPFLIYLLSLTAAMSIDKLWCSFKDIPKS